MPEVKRESLVTFNIESALHRTILRDIEAGGNDDKR